jgi:hypothetical protein
MGVLLPNLKCGLLCRYIIATVTVDKDDTSKSLFDGIVHQAAEHIEIRSWCGGKRTVEIEVVVGVSKPLHGCEQDSILQSRFNAIDQTLGQQRIGHHRQMRTVLLDSSYRKNDWGVGCQVSDFGSWKFMEQHANFAF